MTGTHPTAPAPPTFPAASELQEVRNAVSGVKTALEELRSNSDPARSGMLRLNLREARDMLSRRLMEVRGGGAAGVWGGQGHAAPPPDGGEGGGQGHA